MGFCLFVCFFSLTLDHSDLCALGFTEKKLTKKT